MVNKHAAKAVWFVNCKYFVGPRADDAGKIGFLKELIGQGDIIANHTCHHLDLPRLQARSQADVLSEIAGCSSEIERVTGKKPGYFRAPFRRYTPYVMTVAKDQGMQVVNWSCDFDRVFGFRRRSKVSPSVVRSRIGTMAERLEDGDVIMSS